MKIYLIIQISNLATGFKISFPKIEILLVNAHKNNTIKDKFFILKKYIICI